jgi:hypothetical protein
MNRKVYLFLAIIAIMACCNNSQKPVSETEAEVIELTIAEFKLMAEDYTGEIVAVKGLVNHACRHSGKRMFIVDPETSEGLRIDAGNIVGGFDTSLEGSIVLVTGVVIERRIDEAYLNEWEVEVHEECAAEEAYAKSEIAAGETEEHDNEYAEELDRIARLRQQVLDSEKGYISFFHLECTSFEVIDEDPENN